MSSPIDRLRRLGVGSDPPRGGGRLNLSSDPIAQGLLSAPSRAADEAVIVRAERVYDKPLSVSISERVAEKLQAALNSIRAAREEQYRLADEASSLAQSSRLATLETQNTTQATEITRIRDAASVNGTSLFSGAALDLSVTDVSRNINEAAILPTSSNVAANISASFSTPSQANAAKVLYDRALSEISSLTAGVSSTANDVRALAQRDNPEEVRARAVTEADSRNQAIDPTALASAIASQITDPFITDRARQAIIDTSAANLDPGRVKQLIDEDDKS